MNNDAQKIIAAHNLATGKVKPELVAGSDADKIIKAYNKYLNMNNFLGTTRAFR